MRLRAQAAGNSRSRSPRRGKKGVSKAGGELSSGARAALTLVRLVTGETRALDLRQVPSDDYALLPRGFSGEDDSPTLVFINRCRPVFCMQGTGTPTCYFEGDTMNPVSLVGGCAPGDHTNARLWFSTFLSACVGPMTRLMVANSQINTSLHLFAKRGDGMMLVILLDAGQEIMLTYHDIVDSVDTKLELCMSLEATTNGQCKWQGEPTPRIALALHNMLQAPLKMMLYDSQVYRSLRSKAIEGCTLQLLVPQYLKKLLGDNV
jgi:hypothetical protein